MHDCVVLMLCCEVTVQSLLSRVQKYIVQCKPGPDEAQHGRAFMLVTAFAIQGSMNLMYVQI